jgi:hypothetical protein
MTTPLVTMELEPVPLRRFMPRFDRYEPLMKGSSAIRLWKTCPRLYFLQVVLGFVPKEREIVLLWGTCYHHFRYILELRYGVGADAPKRFDEGKGAEAFAEASQQGLAMFKKGNLQAPPGTKFEFMTTERLLKTFIAAYKHWVKEKQQGRIEVIAVEQVCNIQLADGTYTNIRADQLIRWNGKPWGRDFKATSKDSDWFARGLEPNDQFTRYTLVETKVVGEPVQGQFVELMYNAKSTKNKTNGPEVIELTTSRTPIQLAEFEADQTIVNQHIKVSREADRWPMHEIACPYCPMHSVCKKPTENGMAAALEMNYVQRPWDNTRVGEDEG